MGWHPTPLHPLGKRTGLTASNRVVVKCAPLSGQSVGDSEMSVGRAAASWESVVNVVQLLSWFSQVREISVPFLSRSRAPIQNLPSRVPKMPRTAGTRNQERAPISGTVHLRDQVGNSYLNLNLSLWTVQRWAGHSPQLLWQCYNFLRPMNALCYLCQRMNAFSLFFFVVTTPFDS